MGVSAPTPSASRPFNHKRTGVQQQVLPPESERDGGFVRVSPPERRETTTTHQEGWTPGVLALFRLRKSQHKCSEIVVIHRSPCDDERPICHSAMGWTQWPSTGRGEQ